MKHFTLKTLCLCLSLCLVLTGCSFALTERRPQGDTNGIDVSADIEEETPQEPAPQPPATARFVAVGDNLIHDIIYMQAARRTGVTGQYNFAPAYENFAPLLQGADFAFINQETVLASEVAPLSNYPQFNSPTQVGDDITNIGFNVINHANNHMFDVGEKGYAATIKYWKSNPKALLTGAYENDADLQETKIKTVNDISIAFIGVTQFTNGLTLPKDSEMRYILADELEQIKQLVDAAKPKTDLVAVSVHWGVEGTYAVTEYQRAIAKALADMGVDIIIGHHSHTIQPVEYIDRADGGKTVVVYSLGNFISAQSGGMNMMGSMLDMQLTKNYETGKTTVDDVKFVPLVTHYDWGMANVAVYPLLSYPPEKAAQHGVLKTADYFSLDYLKKTIKDVIDPQFYTPELEAFLAA